jgi:hypothetical protein
LARIGQQNRYSQSKARNRRAYGVAAASQTECLASLIQFDRGAAESADPFAPPAPTGIAACALSGSRAIDGRWRHRHNRRSRYNRPVGLDG